MDGCSVLALFLVTFSACELKVKVLLILQVWKEFCFLVFSKKASVLFLLK